MKKSVFACDATDDPEAQLVPQAVPPEESLVWMHNTLVRIGHSLLWNYDQV